MRRLVTGAVACCVLAWSGAAVARNEWVVLRVERVEVAVAHADGSPWDDAGATGVRCGSGSEDLLASPHWGPIVKAFCIPRGQAPAGPDLQIRLTDGDLIQYRSPVAEDTLVHDFHYAFLIPRDRLPSAGLTIEVIDQDGGDPSLGESLGTVEVAATDVADLLADPSRVKTFSDDAVTRLELTATRYSRRAQRSVAVGARRRAARFAGAVIAGELVEVRASRGSGMSLVVAGGGFQRQAIGRCTRMLVTSGGAIAAGLDDGDKLSANRFRLRVMEPSLSVWRRGRGWTPCDGRRVVVGSIVTQKLVQTTGATTLTALAVQRLIEFRYRAGIQRCHERLLQTDPMAVMLVRVRFTVGPTGSTANVTVRSTDSPLNTCISSLVERWRFSPPKDPQGNPATEDIDAVIVLDTN